ncbi:MAG: hypothetical protein HN341_14400 [Verrucomicrobia bacterium]|jgi:hypothetical protein|nr:hypothetical protein [Verrucomicrobiota bacterium]
MKEDTETREAQKEAGAGGPGGRKQGGRKAGKETDNPKKTREEAQSETRRTGKSEVEQKKEQGSMKKKSQKTQGGKKAGNRLNASEKQAEKKKLTSEERKQLQQHERTIGKAIGGFLEIGRALVAIKEEKLYRAEYGTFAEYCDQRWGFQRRHAYRLIDAVKAVENVSDRTQTHPANEYQARELARLNRKPKLQIRAWMKAQREAGKGKLTGTHVEEAVAEVMKAHGIGGAKSKTKADGNGVPAGTVFFFLQPDENGSIQGYTWTTPKPMPVHEALEMLRKGEAHFEPYEIPEITVAEVMAATAEPTETANAEKQGAKAA